MSSWKGATYQIPTILTCTAHCPVKALILLVDIRSNSLLMKVNNRVFPVIDFANVVIVFKIDQIRCLITGIYDMSV